MDANTLLTLVGANSSICQLKRHVLPGLSARVVDDAGTLRAHVSTDLYAAIKMEVCELVRAGRANAMRDRIESDSVPHLGRNVRHHGAVDKDQSRAWSSVSQPSTNHLGVIVRDLAVTEGHHTTTKHLRSLRSIRYTTGSIRGSILDDPTLCDERHGVRNNATTLVARIVAGDRRVDDVQPRGRRAPEGTPGERHAVISQYRIHDLEMDAIVEDGATSHACVVFDDAPTHCQLAQTIDGASLALGEATCDPQSLESDRGVRQDFDYWALV